MTVADLGHLVESIERGERIAFYEALIRERPSFAEEMAYCAPAGIPHSTFLSWSEEDQDKAIAWQRLLAFRCASCGTFADEWVDERGMRLDPPPFEPVAHICHGCADREAFAADLREERANVDGVTIRLRPFDGDADDLEGED